jgi:hypothetical protein
MALIAYDGTRRIHALLHELALMMRPHTKTVAAQFLAVDDAPPTVKHYPPRRDRVIESAAMRREMYRL